MLDRIRERVRSFNRKEIKGKSLKKAAVLIPIVLKNGSLSIAFTKRTENVEIHKGQYSFPGGAFDRTDRDLHHTALREVKEEIGIDPHHIEILGSLDDSATITDYLITPFVGFIKTEPLYILELFEISKVIEIPLAYLLSEKNWSKEQYTHRGHTYAGEFVDFEGHKIWGATARILRQFIDVIK